MPISLANLTLSSLVGWGFTLNNLFRALSCSGVTRLRVYGTDRALVREADAALGVNDGVFVEVDRRKGAMGVGGRGREGKGLG
jgi:hypothetical protein